MSKSIGPAGVTLMASDTPKHAATFKLDTADTQHIALDPAKTYAVFARGAGPSNVTFAASKDSLDAAVNGYAAFAPVKTYTAMAAAGGLLGHVSGVTCVRVTHAKNGSGTDDANVVAVLGGRFQLRCEETATNSNDTGLGAYTPLTAT